MKLKERIEFIDKKLDELYPNPPIPLDHSDPYTLLIAVLLSAQCTDARVNKVTPKLFRLADTPKRWLPKAWKRLMKSFVHADWLQKSERYSWTLSNLT